MKTLPVDEAQSTPGSHAQWALRGEQVLIRAAFEIRTVPLIKIRWCHIPLVADIFSTARTWPSNGSEFDEEKLWIGTRIQEGRF
jgi:hypothetical protein